MQRTDFGVIGLAVMGRSLALNMADHGFKVGGYNRSRMVTEDLVKEHPHENFIPFYELEELVSSQERPRKFLIMVKAGKPVDLVIDQLVPLLDEGDMILDGGNSSVQGCRAEKKEPDSVRLLCPAETGRPTAMLRLFWKPLRQRPRESHAVPIWDRTEPDIM